MPAGLTILSTYSNMIKSTPGLFAYWCADCPTLDVTETTLVSLPDQSSNGIAARNLTIPTGTGGVAPTWTKADANFNRRPSISSTTANARLQSTYDVALAQPSTAYLVMRVITNPAVMYWRSNGGNFLNSQGFYLTTGLAPTQQVRDITPTAITGANLTTATNYVNCSIYNIGVSAMYFNNSTTTAASGAIDNDSATIMTIGNFSGLNNYSWTEMAVYQGAHDQPTRKKIMDWLGSKYGIITT